MYIPDRAKCKRSIYFPKNLLATISNIWFSIKSSPLVWFFYLPLWFSLSLCKSPSNTEKKSPPTMARLQKGFYSLSFPLSTNPPQSCHPLCRPRSPKNPQELELPAGKMDHMESQPFERTFFLIIILHHLWHWSKASLPLHLSSLGLDHLPLLSDRPYLESERDGGDDY